MVSMVSLTFGPVPSRRLGRSLGINHVPSKICSYSCVYCQVGRTTQLSLDRKAFVSPEQLAGEVRRRVEAIHRANEPLDYLTFVPDGEPTLDVNLGRHIELLRPLGVRIAVLTNGSLLHRADVRRDLAQADWVSVKIDAADTGTWKRVNRPHAQIALSDVLEGALRFARDFRGTLVTETMLVAGVNDGREQLEPIADFLGRLQPRHAYISIPTRPPAEAWVVPPSKSAVVRAREILGRRSPNVDVVREFEGVNFGTFGPVGEEILSISAVHPIREEAMREILARNGADWSLVRSLLQAEELEELDFEGGKFYRRKRTLQRPGAPLPAIANGP